MRRVPFLALAIAGAALLASGCANTRVRDSGAINELITARGAPAATWPEASNKSTRNSDADLIAAKTREPITVKRAVEIAFLRSPAIRERYAELGISLADVIEAGEISNPTIAYTSLRPDEGGGPGQITRSISLAFADLLFLPTRIRLANSNSEVVRDRVAASLLELQGEVESAWYEYVATLQSLRMREAAARAGEASAAYAKRLSDAGNLPPRALALELAGASEARIASAHAKADVSRARAEFAALLGLSTRDSWEVAPSLPALPQHVETQDTLIETALGSRLDLLAVRREVGVLESGLRLTRWWRWLGDFELGYERESETDGARLSGPTFSLGVPLFNLNRSGVLRAEGQVERARVQLDQLELAVRNDIALGLDRLETTREIVEAYRAALIPQREAVSARTLEEANFMLSGAFEALEAKRKQYEAYGEYIEAVRDFWLARVQLGLAVGGKLADDGATSEILNLDEPAPKTAGDAHGDHK